MFSVEHKIIIQILTQKWLINTGKSKTFNMICGQTNLPKEVETLTTNTTKRNVCSQQRSVSQNTGKGIQIKYLFSFSFLNNHCFLKLEV